MRKKNTIFTLLIFCIIVIITISIILLLKTTSIGKNESVNTLDESNTLTNNDISIDDKIINEEVNTYIDENPVKIGIYKEQGNTKQLIKDVYSCIWEAEEIMGLFYVVPTTEETISNTSFNTMWKNYINNYPNPERYRIGYNIKFTLNSGENIDKTILNPEDAYFMFRKVMVFLYDDVNLIPGKAYYHITDMTDDTICSSIKLVGDVETNNIKSNIELTAFLFDNNDDFDENGKYRGNSSYTITITKK